MLNRLMTAYLKRTNRKVLSFHDESGVVARPEPAAGRRYLLYVHIPFCESICPFCSFHRVKFQQRNSHPYFDALRNNKVIQVIYPVNF